MARRCLLVVMVLIALASACSGDDGGDGDDGASLGVTSEPTEVTEPPKPPESPEGTGVVVIGSTSSSFAVTRCELDAPEGAAAGATTLVSVAGTGTTGAGVPFDVEIERFVTGTDVKTFTDTVTYSDTARVLQMQRFEVGGAVTDLRDPDARGTLLEVRPGGVAAAGLAGPPGAVSGKDEGIVGLAIDATC